MSRFVTNIGITSSRISPTTGPYNTQKYNYCIFNCLNISYFPLRSLYPVFHYRELVVSVTCINSVVIQQFILQLTTFNKKGVKQQSLCGMNSPHVGGLLQLVNQWLGVSTVQLLSGLQYLNLAQTVQKFIHLENKEEEISAFHYKLFLKTWHTLISFYVICVENMH